MALVTYSVYHISEKSKDNFENNMEIIRKNQKIVKMSFPGGRQRIYPGKKGGLYIT